MIHSHNTKARFWTIYLKNLDNTAKTFKKKKKQCEMGAMKNLNYELYTKTYVQKKL